MTEYIRLSMHAGLAALGQQWQTMGMMTVIEKHVHIEQKVLRYKPTDKLLDALISLLAGGRGRQRNADDVDVGEAIQW